MDLKTILGKRISVYIFYFKNNNFPEEKSSFHSKVKLI